MAYEIPQNRKIGLQFYKNAVNLKIIFYYIDLTGVLNIKTFETLYTM